MSQHVNEWPSNQTTHYTPILAPGVMLVRRHYKPRPTTSQRWRVHYPGVCMMVMDQNRTSRTSWYSPLHGRDGNIVHCKHMRRSQVNNQ